MLTRVHELISELCREDQRYSSDAYFFVMEIISYTQQKFSCYRHITGEEMLETIKEVLKDKYGPMALTVLTHWGIKKTDDFGNIIFNLVDKKVLSKTEEDDIQTFRNAFDLEEEFRRSYRKELHKKISRLK